MLHKYKVGYYIKEEGETKKNVCFFDGYLTSSPIHTLSKEDRSCLCFDFARQAAEFEWYQRGGLKWHQDCCVFSVVLQDDKRRQLDLGDFEVFADTSPEFIVRKKEEEK